MFLKSYQLTMRHPDLPHPCATALEFLRKEKVTSMRNGQAGLCRWGWMKEGLGKYSKAKSSEGDSPGECALSEKSQDGSGHAAEGQNVAALTCLGLWWKGQASTGLTIAWSLWTLQGRIVCERLENICFSTLLGFSFYTLTLLQI